MDKPNKFRAEIRRYGIAILAALAALGLKLALDPVADQDEVPFVLFPAAVMVAAWYGGTPAGVACTLLGAILSDLFFSTPRYTFFVESTAQRLNLFEFVIEGLIISLLAGALHRARETATTATSAAEQAQLTSESAEARAGRALADQAATNARFRRLVEANIIGVFVADASGKIYEANAAFLGMVGFSGEQLLAGAADWRRMTAEEYADADQAALDEIERHGVCRPYEKELVRQDGTRVPVLVGAAVVESDDKMICFAADLSRRKKVERELASAKEAAETANRAKDEFVASISHDLRTPMNAILGMSDLALGEELPALVRDYIETVKGAADTLLHLLNDLLDVSQFEAGQFELERKPFNLRDVLDLAVKAVSLEASDKGLELACYIHSKVPEIVVGDGRRLGQVVTNLAANAVKFTELGEVVASATVASEVDGSVTVEIVVSDTGIGIPPDEKQMIFAPFTKSAMSTTSDYSGSGLGLAICRQLIERMDGRIWAESKVGDGSKFHCLVPFPLADDGDQPDDHQVVPELREVPILVVDDNATSRRIIHEMLDDWAMKSTVVGDGAQALDELRKGQVRGEPYRVMIVDALMPEMDGLRLVDEAEKANVRPQSTVLMVSSNDRKVLRERCDHLGIDNYLEKPISQSDLLDAVVTGLKGDSIATGVAEPLGSTVIKLHVLLAEDTPANQKVVNAILTKRGHSVTIARNGREAIDLHAQQDFDVVLMDVQMPTMDGYQATQLIRECEDNTKASVPVIAMTAHAMRGARERCLNAGMNAYITKPINAVALVDIVEESARRRPHVVAADDGKRAQDAADRDTGGAGIDWETALSRLGGDEELLRDMIRFFEEDAPKLLDKIDASVQQRDGKEVERAAHSLKGLAANFCTSSAVSAAEGVEEIGRGCRWDEIDKQLPRLRREVLKLIKALGKHAK